MHHRIQRGRIEVAREFDAIAKYYDWLPIQANRYDIRQWLPNHRLEHALDVGCGTGRTLVTLLDFAEHVSGVDISNKMIARAQEKVAPWANRTSVLFGDVERLPFTDASFDVVCCSMVLHHVESLSKALNELSRVLRPGGAALITDIIAGGISGTAPIVGAIAGALFQAHYDLFHMRPSHAIRHLKSGLAPAWLRHQAGEAFFAEAVFAEELRKVFPEVDTNLEWSEFGLTRVIHARCIKI